MFPLIYAWTNGWAKTRDAGDSRRYRANISSNHVWNMQLVSLYIQIWLSFKPLQWRHNKRDDVSNYRRLDCLHSPQRNHQSSASLAFVRGIHRPVTRKMFPFDDVIMLYVAHVRILYHDNSRFSVMLINLIDIVIQNTIVLTDQAFTPSSSCNFNNVNLHVLATVK